MTFLIPIGGGDCNEKPQDKKTQGKIQEELNKLKEMVQQQVVKSKGGEAESVAKAENEKVHTFNHILHIFQVSTAYSSPHNRVALIIKKNGTSV